MFEGEVDNRHRSEDPHWRRRKCFNMLVQKRIVSESRMAMDSPCFALDVAESIILSSLYFWTTWFGFKEVLFLLILTILYNKSENKIKMSINILLL